MTEAKDFCTLVGHVNY